MVKILEYSDIDYAKVRRQYEKVTASLERDDFRSAAVKKLAVHDLYSARLDDTNRLIFKLVQYQNVRYALMLEVVLNHAYDKSKFLRGAKIDETKIPLLESREQAEAEALPSIAYINPSYNRFQYLDKILSFDPEQLEIFAAPFPLIIIGPAGSGKTVLTLEKMKIFPGNGIYVTLSPYLSENARNLYYSNHYENKEQKVTFLSFREYLETIRVPQGREISYSAFAQWLYRISSRQRVADAHRLYEEFRGVITGSTVDKPYLSRAEYLGLGVRQSIFLGPEREPVYGLFEKYLAYLRENGSYDPNILAHRYLEDVRQRYDFAVVDEVQDITNIQLRLILKSLKEHDKFVLCGDSNQIVHPNFFSWSGLKSMFYHSTELEAKKITRILLSNFRNSAAVTGLANRLILIKQKRFGSIDKESTYLMNNLCEKSGEVILLQDTEKIKREMNNMIRRSAKYALIVLRNEDKSLARKYFDTPLIFTVQEAKGLEYENVILLNLITGERDNFQEIVRGVSEEDAGGELRYLRAADKTDKSLEALKFYVNSLYVAITRAIRNLYIMENDTAHALLHRLGLNRAQEQLMLEKEQSTREEWQAEARRLELQGKQEQADEIRRTILMTKPVPWDVLTPQRIPELAAQIRQARDNPQRPRKALFEYALFYDVAAIIGFLSTYNYDKARQICSIRQDKLFFNQPLYEQQKANLAARVLQKYTGNSGSKEVLRHCEIYGIDHRTEYNATSLMLAARTGNIPLVHELLSAGANSDLTDNCGLTAWQISLRRALKDKHAVPADFFQISEMLAPSSVSLKVDEQLIKLDRSQGEFLLFQIFFVLFHSRANNSGQWHTAQTAAHLAGLTAALPDSAVAAYRKKRQYISGLLAKNEVNSQNPYNRKLFRRISTGYYVLNDELWIRHQDEWLRLYDLAGLEHIRRIFPEHEE